MLWIYEELYVCIFILYQIFCIDFLQDRFFRFKLEDIKLDIFFFQIEFFSDVFVGVDIKFKILNIEYEEKIGLLSIDIDMYVVDNVVLLIFDESVIIQVLNDSLFFLRVEVVEFFLFLFEDNI